MTNSISEQLNEPLPAPFSDWPRPFAFALSGGGAFGPVQVGMLEALAERGVQPDLIVGTSVGALHGAAIAASGYGVLGRLNELWSSAHRSTVFGPRHRMVATMLRSRSLATHGRLSAIIQREIGPGRVEDLRWRFAAVATDALTGEPTLLDRGTVDDVLLASCSVPGLFPSVSIDGRQYVDGGVAANVPIRQAIAFGAASVLSIDATPPVSATSVPKSFTGSLLHSASLMLRSQRSSAVDELASRYRIAELPAVTPPDMGSFNFSRAGELRALGYAAASAALEDWVHAERLS